jgi:cyclic pyranopterin phosphate synthase
MANLRKQFITKIYYKHIHNKDTPVYKNIDKALRYGDDKRELIKHKLAEKYPSFLKPDLDIISMALTSQCNLRCKGCSYGRSFMPKEQLSLEKVKEILDSMSAMDIPFTTLYGGEPLMIKSSKLAKIITYARKVGVYPNLSTNGVMIRPSVMDELYDAGLRQIFIGIYGVGDDYNTYVDRKDVFARLDENITYIRQTYPDVSVSLGWLFMKPTCNLKSLREITEFSQKHDVDFELTLVHYDFPYFNNGEEEELQFYEEDIPQILEVKKELIRLKRKHPKLIRDSLTSLNSIEDWLMKKEKIDIPCYRYDRLWIAANGDVRVCQKSVLLGNLHDNPLDNILDTERHQQSVRDCFDLNCTGCHVEHDRRTIMTQKSLKQYKMV